MKKPIARQSCASATFLVIVLMMLANVASACGFHSPLGLRQTMLDWQYPGALWVNSAIMTGQESGALAKPNAKRLKATGAEREFRDNIAFAAVTRALRAFDVGFKARSEQSGHPDISLVLLDTMLWTRYSADGTMELHSGFAEVTDFVVVTGEPVIHAIESGQLTVAAAVEAGYMRLYGSNVQQNNFLSSYGLLGAKPLPKIDRRSLNVQMLQSNPAG